MTIPVDFRRHKFDYAYLAANYDVTPVRQFKLLPNRPEPGLYRKLKDHAVQFTGVKKGGGNTTFFFNTGKSSGNKLLNAAGKTMPPLESWESVTTVPGPVPVTPVPPTPPIPPIAGAMCEFNLALLQLLNLFFLKYTLNLSQPSGKHYLTINQNPGIPQVQVAVSLNTILIAFTETPSTLINWLTGQVGTAKVRAFNFTVLSNFLHSKQPPLPAVVI